MYRRVKQFTLNTPILRKVVGSFFIVTGLIALITPLTPGALVLIVLGLELLGLEIFFIEKCKQKILRHSTKSEG